MFCCSILTTLSEPDGQQLITLRRMVYDRRVGVLWLLPFRFTCLFWEEESVYCETNYKTKKAIKEAIAKDGNAGGVYNPGLGGLPPRDGTVTLEGPHYPEPHTWYAQATLKAGVIVAVK